MKKEVTVTLTDQSHCHAEMVIHKAENMYLTLFIKLGDQWQITGSHDNEIINIASHYEYFLCQPEYVKECAHFLNGGKIEKYCTAAGFEELDWHEVGFRDDWYPEHPFMEENLKVRIKPEFEYVNLGFDKASEAVKFIEDGGSFFVSKTEGLNPFWVEIKDLHGVVADWEFAHKKVEKGV